MKIHSPCIWLQRMPKTQPDQEFIGVIKRTGPAATGRPSCCASWGCRALPHLFQVNRHHPSQAGLQSWTVPREQHGEDEVRAPNPCDDSSEHHCRFAVSQSQISLSGAWWSYQSLLEPEQQLYLGQDSHPPQRKSCSQEKHDTEEISEHLLARWSVQM